MTVPVLNTFLFHTLRGEKKYRITTQLSPDHYSTYFLEIFIIAES